MTQSFNLGQALNGLQSGKDISGGDGAKKPNKLAHGLP